MKTRKTQAKEKRKATRTNEEIERKSGCAPRTKERTEYSSRAKNNNNNNTLAQSDTRFLN